MQSNISFQFSIQSTTHIYVGPLNLLFLGLVGYWDNVHTLCFGSPTCTDPWGSDAHRFCFSWYLSCLQDFLWDGLYFVLTIVFKCEILVSCWLQQNFPWFWLLSIFISFVQEINCTCFQGAWNGSSIHSWLCDRNFFCNTYCKFFEIVDYIFFAPSEF